jgi:hypothetical protein
MSRKREFLLPALDLQYHPLVGLPQRIDLRLQAIKIGENFVPNGEEIIFQKKMSISYNLLSQFEAL